MENGDYGNGFNLIDGVELYSSGAVDEAAARASDRNLRAGSTKLFQTSGTWDLQSLISYMNLEDDGLIV